MEKLTYHIQGLCTSHAAVLRSIILLTEKDVRCIWQVTASANADIVFLGPDAPSDSYYPHAGQVLISVGDGHSKLPLHLDLPLLFPRVAKLLAQATETALEEQKNRPNRQTEALRPSIYNLGFLPPSASGDGPPASGQLYKLKAWPPAGVIGTNRSYMRAAAVLTGKSLTSSQLAEKTSLPLGDCRQFIGKLGDSKCLDISAPGSAPSQPGLAPSAPAIAPSNTSSNSNAAASSNKTASSASTSLFSRIRTRLGFLGKAAS